MKLTTGVTPFRWWMLDDFCEAIPIGKLPPRGDDIWEARYDNDCESGKRTTRTLPAVYATPFNLLRGLHVAKKWGEILGYELYDDDTVHGGGLHVTEPAGWLNIHLDYDLHPRKPGYRRALNFIVFLNQVWDESWGGKLILADAMGTPVVSIKPEPGRLFAFEVSDISYHGVQLITGPTPRVTLACYLLSKATGRETRKRALFFPRR
jgi:2OG-Fe(II) oxygenase superfamily